jgi:predicted XRE-type DNA-binding protein
VTGADEGLGAWPQVVAEGGASLVRAAQDISDAGDVAAVMALRKRGSAELVRAALELVTARRKAVAKLDAPQRLVADVEGVEQATSSDVARHKAQRFAELRADLVVDLCCGIGGDAMALSRISKVVMVDWNPLRAWMAHRNAGAPVAAADVTTLKLGGRCYHIDPSRRSAGRRKWRYRDCEPSPAFIARLSKSDGAVKLSPAVEFSELPCGEIEVIGRRGRLVQAVLWTGRLARHQRTATRIDDGLSFSGAPDLPVPTEVPGTYVYTVDPAIERAGLLGALCQHCGLPTLHPLLGLLTSTQPAGSPWLTAFELIEAMPWRPRKVKQWLHSHGAGIVEVKTRGRVVDPDAVQAAVRGSGDTPFTLFILRFDRKIRALITRRMAP